ncbi:MAG: metallophosphoesterase family protein [Bdellovibrionales bacterium]
MRFFSLKLWLSFIIFPVCLWAQGFQMAVVGDAGKPGNEMEALKQSLLQAGQKVLVMPGDNLYKGTYEKAWDSWKQEGFQFPVVAIGNHHDGYDKEVAYFGMPGEYYSRVIQGVRFIVLNSDNEENVSEQFRWLEKEILRAQEKHLFLVYHHPTFTVTQDHVWQERREFQIYMRQFLKTYHQRITALLLGHDHISTFVQFGPLVAMVAGSGRTLRDATPVNYNEEGFQVRTLYLAPKVQHWGILHFESASDKMRAGFVRVGDQKVVCAIDLSQKQVRMARSCQ